MTSMMSGMLAVLSGIALLVSAGAAAAQSAPKPRPQLAAADLAQPSPARGVIKAVMDTRLLLDTRAPGSGPDTLLIDDRTVVQRLGKTLTVKDLKVGAPVTVTYVMRDGHAVATRIWVRFASPGGKAAAPATAKPAR